jgi:hypothetical protein
MLSAKTPHLFLLLPLSIACAEANPRALAPVVRDSAGVTIIENSAPAWQQGEAWRVAPEPRVDIGVVDGDPAYQLYGARASLRLGDGRIVVANRGSHDLRWYDEHGSFIRAAGGKGGGPGEFQDLRWMGLMPGDSVIAYDIATRRFSVFDAQGIFQRSAAVRGPQYFARGVFADGSVMMMRWENREEGVTRQTTVVVRYGSDGTFLDSLVSLPGPERMIGIEHVSTPRGNLPVWTSQELVFAHNSVLAVGGSYLYAGAQDRYEIDVWDPTGTMVASVRATYNPVLVTEAQVDAYKAEAMAGYSGEDAAYHRALMRETPHADVFPAYGSIVVDAEGNLWVETFRPPGDDQPRWTVFDPEHRMLGTVDMPQGLTVHQIGSDFVLGWWRDDLDVEHVQLYDLIKPQ